VQRPAQEVPITNHPNRSKRTAATNDTGYPQTPGIEATAKQVISAIERGERLARAFDRQDRIKANARDMFAVLQAISGCPQAAPWLARLPFGDGNTWDALQAVLVAVENQ